MKSVLCQNYEKSFEYAKRAADANYARGYYLVAWYYDRKKNMGEAFKYYKKASDIGYPKAMLELARCYRNGIGTDVNDKEALRLLVGRTSLISLSL